jgi:hypothetical protein
MSDFDDMARKHSEESQRRIEDARQAAEQKAREQLEGQQVARRYLETSLIPTLQEAQRALDKTSVPSTINKSWDREADGRQPFVTFFCGKDAVESQVVKFTGDGNILSISNSGRGKKVDREDEPRAIREAVEGVLASYYSHLERKVQKP